MIPSKLIGTVVTPGGPQPFVLDVASGNVTVGRYDTMDPKQRDLAPDAEGAALRQVRKKVKGAREVRLGAYHCPVCGRWVDLSDGKVWDGDRCSRCA